MTLMRKMCRKDIRGEFDQVWVFKNDIRKPAFLREIFETIRRIWSGDTEGRENGWNVGFV
jgi:hypothetical protein